MLRAIETRFKKYKILKLPLSESKNLFKHNLGDKV